MACLLAAALGAAVPCRAGVRTIALKEHLNHHWKGELLHYTLSFKPGECPNADFSLAETGVGRVACQPSDVRRHPDTSVRRVTVSFVTDLRPFQVKRFELRWGSGVGRERAPKTDLYVSRQSKEVVEAGTSWCAVRMPAGTRRYDPPAEPGRVPGPLCALRLRSGRWAGKGYLGGQQKVRSYATRVLAGGPAFVDAETEYTFEHGGRAAFRVRLIAGQDVVLVTESFDTDRRNTYCGRPIPKDRWRLPHVVFNFSPHFRPNLGYFRYRYGQGRKHRDNNRRSFLLGRGPQPFASLTGWMSWQPGYLCWMGVWNDVGGQEDFVGIFARHAGAWVRPMENVLSLYDPSLDAVELRAPVGWGRREWGLVVSRKQDMLEQPSWPSKDEHEEVSALLRVRNKYDAASLDEVKDMVLEWDDARPATTALADGPVTHPRLFFTRDEWPAVKKRFARYKDLHALAEKERNGVNLFAATGDPSQARRLVFGSPRDYHEWGFLRWLSERVEAFTTGRGITESIQLSATHVPAYYAYHYDMAMASDVLTPKQRQYMRACMAFLSYKQADPNFWPMGVGYGMGNPNFQNMHFLYVGLCACALAGHPQSQAWADYAARELERDILLNSAPGGAWIEADGYQLVSMEADIALAMALNKAGHTKNVLNMPRLRQTLWFLSQRYTPKDPRFGASAMAPIGRTMRREGAGLLLWAASAMRGVDDALSGHLAALWQACGRDFRLRTFGPSENFYLATIGMDPGVPAKLVRRTGEHFEGFGCVLWNDSLSDDATYWLGPNGYYERFTDPAMSFILHAKGAPIVTDWGYTTRVPKDVCRYVFAGWMQSKLAVDGTWEVGTRKGQVRDHALLERCDYYWGDHSFDEVADWPFDPMKVYPSKGYIVNTPQRRRHIPRVTLRRAVLFVKDRDVLGPNYFVVADEADSKLPMSWNLWTVTNQITRKTDRLWRGTGQFGVDVDVFFATPDAPKVEPIDEFSSTWAGNTTTQKRMRVLFKKDPTLLWIIYPRRPAEPQAVYRKLAPGAVQVTLPDRRDTALLSFKPMRYEGDGVTFEGRAGLVRRFTSGGLVLVLSQGKHVGAGGYRLAGDVSCSLVVTPTTLTGQADAPGTLTIESREATRALTLTVVGKPRALEREGKRIRFQVDKGTFQIRRQR